MQRLYKNKRGAAASKNFAQAPVPPHLLRIIFWKFQVKGEKNAKKLVFHDCVVSYWYWGDYNNKLPKIWHKRDLFNALYGTPPMYLFDKQGWAENKHRIAASYQLAAPVSRMTGRSPMVSHAYLTADRKVQQTRFANGVVVTVNFGKTALTLEDGFVLKPQEYRLEEGR